MSSAVEAVKLGKYSRRQAAKLYKVPFTTMQNILTGKAVLKDRPGPGPVLGEYKQELVAWITSCSRCGFPVTKDHLLNAVKDIVTRMKKEDNIKSAKIPFKNDRPSNEQLAERMSQNLTRMRAQVSEESIREWFSIIGRYLQEKNLVTNISPRRVFNLDESGFLLSPAKTKVIVPKSDKAAYSVCNSDKECYTGLFTGNAAGELLPTVVVYPHQTIPAKIAKNFPKGLVIGKSQNGWMTKETFYMFLGNVFYPWCVENEVEFPVVLFVDGHSSHLTLPLARFCHEKKIELIALYPHATHILQPMDVAIFGPLKGCYRKAVEEWKTKNNYQPLDKYHFAEVLKNAIDSLDVSTLLKSGFKACGLFPLDENSVNYSKLFHSKSSSNTRNSDLQCQINVNMDQIEKNIDPTVLSFFYHNFEKGEWCGPLEYKQLFLFWFQLKNSCIHCKQSILHKEQNDQGVGTPYSENKNGNKLFIFRSFENFNNILFIRI